MYNTLKLLTPFVNETLAEESYEVLCSLYKDNPSTVILATVYKKVFNLAIVIKNQYWGLNDEDVASFCLEKLNFCLLNYDIRPGRQAKFITYFCKVFSNKLREETEALNYKKRKCILESINEIIDIGLEDTYNVIEMLLPNTLTKYEYEYCILASEGYDNTYIAEQLGVSRMTVSNIRKSLRYKLNDLQFD